MVCPNCGMSIDDNSKFCAGCGTKIETAEAEPKFSFEAEVKIGDTEGEKKAPGSFGEKDLKWAKFLGYFGLWAGALINLSTAISLFSGNVYGPNMKELVYATFPTLKVLDPVYALLLLAVAALDGLAAFSIIKRKAAAITLVPMLYLVTSIISIVYTVMTTVIISAPTFDASSIVSICGGIVMFFVNKTYFNNRNNIFVN